ncbi:uncharacterized protein LOC131651699 [Vicia villosa]|uniref:uncharacterized protein LOC131651699 n=1 Tax=Vicia villosa TaxID=3911 RepID=UPI00273CD322|nr:uncharacterized protein LOC131651699 [Vicia villosa]
MLLQKARVKWDSEGDLNSKFFHSVMKSRRRSNCISHIQTELESVGEVKEEVKRNFEEKFVESGHCRPILEGDDFRSLSQQERESLEVPFSESEIKEAVWSCEESRSPGPDGLNKVMSSLISSCQTTFVPGRMLLDGVLIVNEVVDYATKFKKGCLLFKVDFAKAYDKVSWGYLRSPTKDFKVGRGLRQGDPLSAFLFVIATEGLVAHVKQFIQCNDFYSFSVEGNCDVDVLKFADDTLLVGNGYWKQVCALKAVLRGFEVVSGLGVNFIKSMAPVAVYREIENIHNKFIWGGCGNDIPFWSAVWFGSPKLLDAFSSIFEWSHSKEAVVSSLGCWFENRWVWDCFGVDRSAPASVLAAVTVLKGLLLEVFPERSKTDSVVWKPRRGSGYSTNSGYNLLIKDYEGPAWDSDVKLAFDSIWKSNVPYRIKAFRWRCLWNRLPTKYLLVRRGISLSINDQLCVFCSVELETLDHILLGCPFSKLVWKDVFLW